MSEENKTIANGFHTQILFLSDKFPITPCTPELRTQIIAEREQSARELWGTKGFHPDFHFVDTITTYPPERYHEPKGETTEEWAEDSWRIVNIPADTTVEPTRIYVRYSGGKIIFDAIGSIQDLIVKNSSGLKYKTREGFENNVHLTSASIPSSKLLNVLRAYMKKKAAPQDLIRSFDLNAAEEEQRIIGKLHQNIGWKIYEAFENNIVFEDTDPNLSESIDGIDRRRVLVSTLLHHIAPARIMEQMLGRQIKRDFVGMEHRMLSESFDDPGDLLQPFPDMKTLDLSYLKTLNSVDEATPAIEPKQSPD